MTVALKSVKITYKKGGKELELYEVMPAHKYNCAGFALGTYDIPEFPTWNLETYNKLLNSKGAKRISKHQIVLDRKAVNLVDSWFEKKFLKSLAKFGLEQIQLPQNKKEIQLGTILLRFRRVIFQDFHFVRKIEVEGENCWGFPLLLKFLYFYKQRQTFAK